MKESTIIEALSWRYACKRFDSTKKLSDEKLERILTALNLTPTSMGMQLMKFIVIEDEKLKAALLPFAHNQRQVVDCSHLLVLCRETSVTDEFIDEYINRSAELRNQDLDSPKILGFRKMLESANLLSETDRVKWLTNQVFIALGVLLTACALEKVDSCPMEGFIPFEFDEILGLTERGLSSVVVCPIGYRHADDIYQNLPKVRRELNTIVEFR